MEERNIVRNGQQPKSQGQIEPGEEFKAILALRVYTNLKGKAEEFSCTSGGFAGLKQPKSKPGAYQNQRR